MDLAMLLNKPRSEVGVRLNRSSNVIVGCLTFFAIGIPAIAIGHGASGGSHNGDHGHAHGRFRVGWHAGRVLGGRAYPPPRRAGWHVNGHGFFFASLPPYCRLAYWEGVPFYYADDLYYEWNADAGAYEQVQPPAGLLDSLNARPSAATELFVFPDGGQSNAQLREDQDECRRFAVQEVGIDTELRAGNGEREAIRHADAACLEARHYSVQ